MVNADSPWWLWYLNGSRLSFLCLKLSSEVIKDWSSTSTPPYAFMVYLVAEG